MANFRAWPWGGRGGRWRRKVSRSLCVCVKRTASLEAIVASALSGTPIEEAA